MERRYIGESRKQFIESIPFEEIETLIANNLDTKHYTTTPNGGIEAKGRGGKVYFGPYGSIVLTSKDGNIQMNVNSFKLAGVKVLSHSITFYISGGGITIVF